VKVLKLRVRAGYSGVLEPVAINQRLGELLDAVDRARVTGAQTATQVSRSKIKRVRELSPPRQNRYHGLKDAVKWQPPSNSETAVALNLAHLNKNFPPWLVQEIGTGQRAVQRAGGRPNPIGRPSASARQIRTVKSQKGRRISNAFVFASGGKYSAPRRGVNTDALVPRNLLPIPAVTGAPLRFDPSTRRAAAGIRISKEIEGQHFVRDGAKEGFREYRRTILAAARTQLRKPR
jgi:hypothetical protein